jgi:hypothetical protein
MALERSSPFLKGSATIRSPLFSRTWTARQGDTVIATAHRSVWRRTSRVVLADETIWDIVPAGWGKLEIRSGTSVLGVAERLNWLGRRWTIDSQRFGYMLSARSMLLRRWTIDLGDHPVGSLRGAAFSFNRIDVDAGSGIPLEVIMVSWHIVVRAWEAAASTAGA